MCLSPDGMQVTLFLYLLQFESQRVKLYLCSPAVIQEGEGNLCILPGMQPGLYFLLFVL